MIEVEDWRVNDCMVCYCYLLMIDDDDKKKLDVFSIENEEEEDYEMMRGDGRYKEF